MLWPLLMLHDYTWSRSTIRCDMLTISELAAGEPVRHALA